MSELVHVQHIVGQRVRDAAGRVAGRIESIRASVEGPRCLIDEYHLGTAALLSRFGFRTAHLFGFSPAPKLLRVPWQQMDLSDPSHPRIRCSVEELKQLQAQLPPFEDEGPPKPMAGKE